MKINNIDFVSSDGVSVENFSFRDLNSENPYNVKEIIGLDADEIIPKFYGFSDSDFTKYYSLSLEKRQIVISVSLNPQYSDDQTYSTLRDRLYRIISSSRTGLTNILFKDETEPVAQIFGFVTKFESDLFTRSPEVKITLDCDDPVIKSVEQIELDTSEFGNLPTILDEVSTAPHGFEFGITIAQNVGVFLMHDQVASGWRFQVIFPFLVGDQIRFSSMPNDKFFYVVRAGVTTHLIDKLLVDSIWPILFPGNNVFYISTSGSPLDDFTWDYLRHYYSYWGV